MSPVVEIWGKAKVCLVMVAAIPVVFGGVSFVVFMHSRQRKTSVSKAYIAYVGNYRVMGPRSRIFSTIGCNLLQQLRPA